VIDGQVDCSRYTRAQLFDALRHIDGARYPLNLASLERELATRPPDPPPEPVAVKPFPEELDRWNWGAFVFVWIWGMPNRTYRSLWSLIPVVNIVMAFVLGARGSRWAWQHNNWDGVDHFKRVQRRWAIAAPLFVLLLIGGAWLLISAELRLRNSEVVRVSVEIVSKNPEAAQLLGDPVAPGWLVIGKLLTSGEMETEAHLKLKVAGPKGNGWLTIDGKKDGEQWKFEKLMLTVEGRKEPIDVAPKTEK
jgi:hypothetical protein